MPKPSRTPDAATTLPGDTEAYLARVESYIGWDGRPDPEWGPSDVLASKRVIRELVEQLASLTDEYRALRVDYDALIEGGYDRG